MNDSEKYTLFERFMRWSTIFWWEVAVIGATGFLIYQIW